MLLEVCKTLLDLTTVPRFLWVSSLGTSNFSRETASSLLDYVVYAYIYIYEYIYIYVYVYMQVCVYIFTYV